jgi:hypothetical protein
MTDSLLFAAACGLVFGTIAVLLMLPMSFPNKRAALAGAFASRFAIGFLVPLVAMPIPAVMKGVIVGLLISLPDAIITRGYVPILAIGALGGGIIGWISQ